MSEKIGNNQTYFQHLKKIFFIAIRFTFELTIFKINVSVEYVTQFYPVRNGFIDSGLNEIIKLLLNERYYIRIKTLLS